MDGLDFTPYFESEMGPFLKNVDTKLVRAGNHNLPSGKKTTPAASQQM